MYFSAFILLTITTVAMLSISVTRYSICHLTDDNLEFSSYRDRTQIRQKLLCQYIYKLDKLCMRKFLTDSYQQLMFNGKLVSIKLLGSPRSYSIYMSLRLQFMGSLSRLIFAST